MHSSMSGTVSPILILDLLFSVVAIALFLFVHDVSIASLIAIAVVAPVWVLCRFLYGRANRARQRNEQSAPSPSSHNGAV